MKRIIILLLMLPVLSLWSCSKEKEIFPPSSERWEALMTKTMETLLSSEQGWYLSYYQGWSAEQETGGYWFLCQFNEDNTVTAASELKIDYSMETITGDTIDESYPVGSTYTSDFEILPRNIPVLTFNTLNPILHYFIEPSFNDPNGKYGDPFTYQIWEVQDDYIKLRGVRTGKYLHLYRKTDDKTVQKAMEDIAATCKNIDDMEIKAGGFVLEGVANANKTVTKVNRTIELRYTYEEYVEQEIPGTNGETEWVLKETEVVKIIPFIPSLDGETLELSSPTTFKIDGGSEVKVTKFSKASSPANTFESDDYELRFTLTPKN